MRILGKEFYKILTSMVSLYATPEWWRVKLTCGDVMMTGKQAQQSMATNRRPLRDRDWQIWGPA